LEKIWMGQRSPEMQPFRAVDEGGVKISSGDRIPGV
jgi:hypothetical protein